MDGEPVRRVTFPQALIALAAFLIPVIGGQISTDLALPLAPGIGNLLRSVLGGPWLQGFETPLLSHLAIGLPISLAMAISLFQRSVIQLPSIRLSGLMVAFFGLLFASVGLSEFRQASLAAIGEWLLYALVFFASVAVLGRRDGPRLVLTSLFAGVALIALYGIGIEYQEMRALDPNHRVFAGWVNPNATAGILAIGLSVGFGLAQALERVPRLLVGIGQVLIAVALFLTGSKAGLGAAIVCVGVFALLAAWLSQGASVRLRRAAYPVVVLVLGFGLFFLIQKANSPTQTASTSGIGRISSYNETQAQSLGFRKLLWQGSFELTKRQPTGYGLGTYRFEGSRPGLTTQTQLAHNNVLQLAVEASWLAPLLLIGTLALWAILAFRGTRAMPDESNMMLAAISAGLVATFAHGVFESNLYYFGIGIAFFLLMGIGLCLSADSVAPEFTPRGARIGLAFAAAIPVLAVSYFGWGEWQRAQLRYSLQSGDMQVARRLADGIVLAMPIDGEAWNTIHLIDSARRGEAIERAVAANPSPRILRNLAKYHETTGKFASAESALARALERDPNNMNTLRLGLEISQSFKDEGRARFYAERMVEVEKTPYFQIRALPQLVETSTAEARVYLASKSGKPTEKAAILQPALDILVQYSQATVPEIKKFAQVGGDFGGESATDAIAKCRKGVAIARELEAIYREIGETDKSTVAAGTVAGFEAAIGSLAGTR